MDTHDELIAYLHEDSEVARSEGFSALARVRIDTPGNPPRRAIATLNMITGDLLEPDEIGLSDSAWRHLGLQEGAEVTVRHPEPVTSLSDVRAKVYGRRLDEDAMRRIIADVVAGRYANAHLAAFITASAGDRLDEDETTHLTRAMIDAGQRLTWGENLVVDKHSVGGLPGNRTTPLVVSIVASHGLTMPKTSSRAITSPAGTADTVETLTPVNLNLEEIRHVVQQEGGCMAWGGAVRLSPADDILIRVERALDLDSEGQLVASVLSKKAAAGSTHVVIDMPVGPTAKVRDHDAAHELTDRLRAVGRRIGLHVDVVITDGTQPVGRGIGPALEARDLLAVLQQTPDRPRDLEERACVLAGRILEIADAVDDGEGEATARDTLQDGRAWRKFQAICEAQGGLRTPPRAEHTRVVAAPTGGVVGAIDNRRLARVAKLAGAPGDPAAGLELHTPLGTRVEAGDPLFTIHSESPGELDYALEYVEDQPMIVYVSPDEAR